MGTLNVKPRTIFCRDNLDILERINSQCIDLIYLDPPFNKKKVFTAPIGSSAEGAEFSDIFREEDVKDGWVKSIEYENYPLYSYLLGVKEFGGKYNYCYLVYMAIRLIECRRILKDTGSVYLHCDPTMSHYLKIVMDCVFGEKNFRNEIVWGYRGAGYPKKDFGRRHDILLRYSKSHAYTFNLDEVRESYANATVERFKHHIGNKRGKTDFGIQQLNPLGKHPDDWWQIQPIAPSAKERTGYPTQKPLALLERIIKASSSEGDVVLDPFCGCATTCIAAEKWGRKWVGIDVSQKAYELVNIRLKNIYAEQSATSKTFPLLSKGYIEAHFTASAPKRGKDERREQGYVYIISNDNWQGRYKVGIAKDPQRRLNSYQTSDPFRAYKLEWSVKTPHYKEVESAVHRELKAENEWIKGDIETIKKTIKKYQRKKPR